MAQKEISLTPLTWINSMQISFILPTLVIHLFLFFITGCTSRGDAIADTSPTMAEIYADAMHQSNGDTLDVARSKVSLISSYKPYNTGNKNHFVSPYVQTSIHEINEANEIFSLVRNPQLTMYVYPHLAGNNEAPVPGYFTAFSLYEKNYYAVPGE